MPLESPRRGLTAVDLSLIASFAALIAALGLPGALTVGGTVPITLQTLGVMLAGSVLGWRRGMLAVITFLALVAVGLPLLAGGRGGIAVFVGPSAGYLIGWIIGAGVIGWIIERHRPPIPTWWFVLANVTGGIAVIYAIGIPVQAFITQTSGVVATAVAAVVYLPGDAVKVVIASLVAAGVHRAYPQLLPGSGQPSRRARDQDG
jgi:biotin transport system substrate-specific component